MDFFTSNGADKPNQEKTKPWHRTSIGSLMILMLLVAIVVLIFWIAGL